MHLYPIILISAVILMAPDAYAESRDIRELELELKSVSDKLHQKEIRIRNLLYERDRRGDVGGDASDQKDLIIRNLRRQIFDLESQAPSDSREKKLRQTIRRLKEELKLQQGEWHDSDREEVIALENQIDQFKATITILESNQGSVISEQVKVLTQRVSDAEAKLQEKTTQLNKANELVATVVAERTDVADQLKELRASYEQIQGKLQAQTIEMSAVNTDLLTQNKKLGAELIDVKSQTQIAKDELESQQTIFEEKRVEDSVEKKRLEEKLEQQKTALQKELSDQIDKLDVYKRLIDKQDVELVEIRDELKQKTTLNEELSRDSESKMTETIARLATESKVRIEELNQRYKKQVETLNVSVKQKDQLNIKISADFDKRIAAALEDAEQESQDKIEYLNSEHQIQLKDLQLALQKLKQSNTQANSDYESRFNQAKLDLEQSFQAKMEKLALQGADDISELKEKLSEKDEALVQLQQSTDQYEGNAKKLEELQKKYKSDKNDWERKLASLESEQLQGSNKVQVKVEEIKQMHAKALEELQSRIEGLNQDRVTFDTKAQEKDQQLAVLTKEKGELASRIEFLLAESANQEKQMAALQVQLADAGALETVHQDLITAEKLISGFKEDVEAKTEEIIRMADEQTDLRTKLKQVMAKNVELVRARDEVSAKLQDNSSQKQADAIKTALSKAKQETAQRDAEIEVLQKRQLVLGREVEELTRELNQKISKIGELDLALLNESKKYSPEMFDRMKQPLIGEISTLKKRVSELEMQLLESWDTAENMLIELKNHPNIRKSLETVVQSEN